MLNAYSAGAFSRRIVKQRSRCWCGFMQIGPTATYIAARTRQAVSISSSEVSNRVRRMGFNTETAF